MYEFKLPDVGEGIHEAEILNWLVNVGDKVAMNQPILEIQTDKAIVEIPSPVAGKVVEIKAEPGVMAHVGDVLIAIAPSDVQTVAPQKPSNGRQADKSPAATQQPTSQPVQAGIAAKGKRVLAAPAVRKMALEMGIDLTDVPGSGPAGRVLPSDLRQFAEQQKETKVEPPADVQPEPVSSPAPIPSAEPAPVRVSQPGQEIIEEEPLQGLRRRIAERMELAWDIPHVTSFEEIEVSKLVTLRKTLQPKAEQRSVKLTYLPFIIKAVVQALKEFPYFNATLDMDRQQILHHRYYHIGVATAVPDGLLVPVIKHADQMNLIQLAGELKRLGELAHQRKLNLNELTGSTFTITNFGSYGGWLGTPIINAPEVAILGTGRIEERPVVIEGDVVARPLLPVALSYDHRLIDGAASGQFLARLKALLNDPNLLFLEMV